MKSLFIPAMKLMDRFSYKIKFLMVVTIFLTALVFLSNIVISDINSNIATIEKQQQGLNQLIPSRNLIEGLVAHRDISQQVVAGDKTLSGLLDKKPAVVTASLNELQKLNSNEQLSQLSKEWDALKNQTGKLNEADNQLQHAAVVESAFGYMQQLGDDSGLTQDSSLDTFYMTDLVVYRLVHIADSISESLWNAGGVIKAEGFTPQSWSLLSKQVDRLKTIEKEMHNDLNKIGKHNPEVMASIKPYSDKANLSVTALLKLLSVEMLDAEDLKVTSARLNTVATEASTNVNNLYEYLVPLMGSIFEDRIAENSSAMYSTFGIIVLTLIIIAYLFSGFYLSVQDAIEKLSFATDKLAQGDLTSRVELSCKDEMSNIADAFNNMAGKFNSLVSEVMSSTTQVASAAEEMSAITVQTAQGVTQQQQDIEQVAAAINEMSATVQEVSNNAHSAAESANKANDDSSSGQRIVAETVSVMNNLANEVESAAGVIHELEKESESIGTVLDVIKSIAEQTNLLALNAAIEAARAGEQGRGFAVVADEVRTLAQRTQQSTSEIESMISKLQSSAGNAVVTMERGRDSTRQGVEKANEAGVALTSITEAVADINDINAQIASASEEQSSVAEEINRSITQISEVAEQTADASQQNHTASGELAQLSDSLQHLVASFKV